MRIRKIHYSALLMMVVLLGFLYISNQPKTTVVDESSYSSKTPPNELYCHSLNLLESLPDIQDTDVHKDQSIFFFETSCKSHLKGKLVINQRQACAVESAALMNPHKTVYLLFASPGILHDEKTESDRLLKSLMLLPNVKVLRINLNRFVKGTPVENLWTTGRVFKSKYQLSHTSDVLRFLVLWMYGGIYLDLDVVVIKSLKTLPANFAGAESENTVASGVMGFSSDGIGHEHVDWCLKTLSAEFNGEQWGANGPLMITRLVHRVCNTTSIRDSINANCQYFHVLPPKTFYPIYYPSWKMFFDETQLDNVKKQSNDSFLIHTWNKLSSQAKAPLYTNVPYLHFARQHCPETIRNLEEYF